MLEWLKSLWAKWKVQISFVGGVLIIATAYGQCTLEPGVEEVSKTEVTSEATDTIVETTTVSNTSEESTDVEATISETSQSTD